MSFIMFILFYNVFFYLFFRLSLYRSLARKDIRTRNSISAYPQIKKMAHKRALNVWNHENKGKFFDFFNKRIFFSILLWKDFVLNRQNWQKKTPKPTKKRPWTKKKWTWKLTCCNKYQIPNYLTKKKKKNPTQEMSEKKVNKKSCEMMSWKMCQNVEKKSVRC